MATIYYPAGTLIYQRNTTTGSLVELSIDVPPASIFFFTGSGNQLTSSIASASYSLTASAVGSIPGYIMGFNIEWMASSSFRVSNGVADIEQGNSLYSLTPAWTVVTSSAGLATSSFHYVYLTPSNSIELSPTAPAAPYVGSARSKTGDSSRRFLFAVLTTTTASTFYRFDFQPHQGLITYLNNSSAAPFRFLTNGMSTASVSVSASAIVPPVSNCALIRLTNSDAVQSAAVGPTPLTTGSFYFAAAANNRYVAPFPMVSQSLNYAYLVAPTNGLYFDLLGYYFER